MLPSAPLTFSMMMRCPEHPNILAAILRKPQAVLVVEVPASRARICGRCLIIGGDHGLAVHPDDEVSVDLQTVEVVLRVRSHAVGAVISGAGRLHLEIVDFGPLTCGDIDLVF